MWKEAEQLQVHAMEATVRVLGEEHLATLASMSKLANTLSNLERWQEAEQIQL